MTKPNSNDQDQPQNNHLDQNVTDESSLPQTGDQHDDQSADDSSSTENTPLESTEGDKPQSIPFDQLSQQPTSGNTKTDSLSETLSADAANTENKPKSPSPLDPSAKDTQVLSRNSSLMRRALSSQQSGSGGKTTSTLGDTREIILLVRGMVERVVMREGVNYKLGRFDLGASAEDEIDLTPYGAMDRGVSRIHAELHLQDDQLYITDLESTNGTYIAGSRIDPNTPTTLRKGDELLLGRLAVQVLFR